MRVSRATLLCLPAASALPVCLLLLLLTFPLSLFCVPQGASDGCEHSVQTFFSDVRFFNYLEGTIPACVWNMSHLNTLHLNANGFSGSLHEIAPHSPLIDLKLSHNRLTGSIPVSIQERQFKGTFCYFMDWWIDGLMD